MHELLFIGLRHQLEVISCSCEAFPVSLARLRLWPTSSKHPKFALSFELLDWMEALLLECQVSVSDFCKALNTKIPKYVIVIFLHLVFYKSQNNFTIASRT